MKDDIRYVGPRGVRRRGRGDGPGGHLERSVGRPGARHHRRHQLRRRRAHGAARQGGGRVRATSTPRPAASTGTTVRSRPTATAAENGNGHRLVETSPKAPVSLYAKTKIARRRRAAEDARRDFTVVLLRNATVYGLSYRMRFDLVINLMTLYAYKTPEAVRAGRRRRSGGRWFTSTTSRARSCWRWTAPREKVGGRGVQRRLERSELPDLPDRPDGAGRRPAYRPGDRAGRSGQAQLQRQLRSASSRCWASGPRRRPTRASSR